MENKALNGRMIDRAGFGCYAEPTPGTSLHWIYPDGTHDVGDAPDFVGSLDTCFKWLVPKLRYETITFIPITGTLEELDSIQKWGCRILQKGWSESTSAIGDSKNPALALCLAIDKLFDKGDSNKEE